MVYNEKVFKNIAEAVLSEYSCVYYVNAVTNEYRIYSASSWFRSVYSEFEGNDFFEDVRKLAEKIIHEDDKYIFLNENLKAELLEQVKTDTVHLTDYRVMIEGKPVYHRSRLIRGINSEDNCFIFGIQDVEQEVRKKNLSEKYRKEREIYNQIAECLAGHFDTLYYVDIESNEYFEYSSTDTYKKLEIPDAGSDFFTTSYSNLKKYVHPEDQKWVIPEFEKEYMLKRLSGTKMYSITYRLVVDGCVMNCRCTKIRANDKKHIVLGLENIDDEVKKEQEQMLALKHANELARSDGLTGAKNMLAFRELEKSIQKKIENETGYYPFAIVISDINNLKHINDTLGHKTGDDYIRAACRMVTEIFACSPVFRIGGDEFACVLVGSDYENRIRLVDMLKKRAIENLENSNGPVVATGLAAYDPINDKNFSDVFNRADSNMYEDKMMLKSGELHETENREIETKLKIPAERKRILDGLFEMLSLVNDRDYIYVCDMRYDFSRWSKDAVERYGMPSEYMYYAGDLWKEHVHAEDREAYEKAVENIFKGTALRFDLRYRSRKKSGEYNICSGIGMILNDGNGEPEYFFGAINDLGPIG